MKILIKSDNQVTNLEDVSNLKINTDSRSLHYYKYIVEGTTNGNAKFEVFRSKYFETELEVNDWFKWFNEELSRIPKDSKETYVLEYPKERHEKIIEEAEEEEERCRKYREERKQKEEEQERLRKQNSLWYKFWRFWGVVK